MSKNAVIEQKDQISQTVKPGQHTRGVQWLSERLAVVSSWGGQQRGAVGLIRRYLGVVTALGLGLSIPATAQAVNFIAYMGFLSAGDSVDITDELSPGASYNFASRWRYESWYSSPSSVKATWSIDGVKLAESTDTRFGNYTSVTLSSLRATTWVATPGTHTITFTEDPDSTVAESLETDNQVSRTFTVTEGTPEIDIQGNTVSIANGDNSPSLTDYTDFGPVLVGGGGGVRTFTISNSGSKALHLSAAFGPKVVVGGAQAAEFAVQAPLSSRIASGTSTTFRVTFKPLASGLRSATLSIANDDADEPSFVFSIQGTGTTAPEMDVQGNSISIAAGSAAPSLANGTDFGQALVAGVKVVRTFTIRNTGSAPLNLDGTPRVVVSGAQASDFTVSSQPATPVATNGTASFQVTFDPSVSGLRSATLSMANDDSDENPYTIAIQGTGTIAPAMYAPELVSHGTVTIRWSSQTNHLYTIHYSTNLLSGFSVLQGNIPATPPMNVYTDSVNGAMTRFWKVTTVE